MATQQEIDEMETNAFKSKYTFRLQYLVNGTWKYKVRLVDYRYSQIAGHDFNETFAPTAKFKSICIVPKVAAIFDRELRGIDIENAFLESVLPVDTYSEPNGKPVIVRLKKSLYGLKQANELFYKLTKRILTSEDTGMRCCMCVFTQFDDETNERVIVLLWVDDIVITGNIESYVNKISNLGEITRYIGIDLTRDRTNHTLELTQILYTKSVIAKFGPNLKATGVPLNPYHDYRAKNEGEVNPPLHCELGSLRHLSDRTKPTLQLPLSLLQTGALNPTQVQIDGVKHVI